MTTTLTLDSSELSATSTLRTGLMVAAAAAIFFTALGLLAVISATAADPLMGQTVTESMIVDVSSALFRAGAPQ